ncbi:MAG: 50S ribosomal protein L29 [Acidobacteria bacterium RIFCSPLOWO2_12_FULL_60_22]|nr:MAG: 50S ribosomal protein L29 [Acidobacteria bacterium RIFCSPLOWO2_12_FULL_60_22]
MKASKVRELTDQELEAEVRDIEGQIWKLRFQAATGQAEGLRKLRPLRKEIARAKTILRERELSEAHGK